MPNCIPSKEFTWLFKDPNTGFYYLNLPLVIPAENNYGNPVYTYWKKVRINSKLSQSMTQVQLFVKYLGLGYNSDPCTGNTVDTTYAMPLPSPDSLITDFGSVSDCGFQSSTTRVVLDGTPFSLPEQMASWTALEACNYLATMSGSCASMQDCTVSIVGDCGVAYFRGLLGVYNATQFAADVRVACALNGKDRLLSCQGDERFCSDPCIACPAGTYSSETNASSCQQCRAGTYSTSIGAVTHGRCCAVWFPYRGCELGMPERRALL